MNILKIMGKYLDQPVLVAKFEQKVPHILTIGGGAYIAHEIKHTEPEKRNKKLLSAGITMLFTVLSALAAPKMVNKIFKKFKGKTPSDFKKNIDNPCF